MIKRTATVVVTIGLLALAGCGSDDSGSPAASTPTTQAPAPTTATTTAPKTTTSAPASKPAAVPDALKFTGTTLDGKRFDGSTLAGKPTVLWFWAPWCPKCRAQASETAKVAGDYQGKVNFVGVAGLDKSTKKMRDFVADNNLAGFPQLADDEGTVWKRFEVVEQSTYVLLDASGKTVGREQFPGGKGLSEKVAGLAG